MGFWTDWKERKAERDARRANVFVMHNAPLDLPHLKQPDRTRMALRRALRLPEDASKERILQAAKDARLQSDRFARYQLALAGALKLRDADWIPPDELLRAVSGQQIALVASRLRIKELEDELARLASQGPR